MTFKIADLVRETTATSGTGTYTLSGVAASGHRTFQAGIGDGNTCLYCVTDGLTRWEINKGVYTNSGTTLTRASLVASSTGSAINWPDTAAKDVFVVAPAQQLMKLLSIAIADAPSTLPALSGLGLLAIGPSSSVSNVLGVAIGDGNTVTENRGAAVGGVSNTVSGGAGGVIGGSGVQVSGYCAGAAGGLFTEAAADLSFVSGDSSKSRSYGARAMSSGTLNNTGDSQREEVCFFDFTSNATPKIIYPGGNSSAGPIAIPDGFAYGFRGSVVAFKSNGDASYWYVSGLLKRVSGTLSLVGSVTKTVVAQDAGASTWDIAITADDTNKLLQLQVTGQAASVINWSAELVLNEVIKQ